jgi:hypothetical protein
LALREASPTMLVDASRRGGKIGLSTVGRRITALRA